MGQVFFRHTTEPRTSCRCRDINAILIRHNIYLKTSPTKMAVLEYLDYIPKTETAVNGALVGIFLLFLLYALQLNWMYRILVAVSNLFAERDIKVDCSVELPLDKKNGEHKDENKDENEEELLKKTK
ncbi:unnamed protein product [Darwinula stevensoni]|uniref:Uncharacterized protein n=1 Tax=Darwinula stevensoni TaxID=69355 RepID=A0A7R9FR62_9CRUS|nr:unnamed protein product [Darwinula stevensoni]CAG0900704.1 unnamed protein product [Darwinula stevensoni]